MIHLRPPEPHGPERQVTPFLGVPEITPRVENLYRVFYDAGQGEEWQRVFAPSEQEAREYVEFAGNAFLVVRHVEPIPFDLSAEPGGYPPIP